MGCGHTPKIPFFHGTLKPLAFGHARYVHVLTGYEVPCVDFRSGWWEVDWVIMGNPEFLDGIRRSLIDVAFGIMAKKGFGDVLPFAFSST